MKRYLTHLFALLLGAGTMMIFFNRASPRHEIEADLFGDASKAHACIDRLCFESVGLVYAIGSEMDISSRNDPADLISLIGRQQVPDFFRSAEHSFCSHGGLLRTPYGGSWQVCFDLNKDHRFTLFPGSEDQIELRNSEASFCVFARLEDIVIATFNDGRKTTQVRSLVQHKTHEGNE